MTSKRQWLAAIVCSTALAGGLAACKSSDDMSCKNMSCKNMNTSTATAKGDIIDVATGPGMEQVTTLVTAVKAAGLVDTLKGTGPFTVFAPTNEAFAKLPAGTLDNLLKPENKEQLKNILLYHVHVGDAIMAKDVKTMSLTTAEGQPLRVSVEGGTVMINNAKVIKTDVQASNGVIHWIDTVLMPPAK